MISTIIEDNFRNDPVHTLLTIVAAGGFCFMILSHVVMSISKFFMVLFGGVKAAKSIRNELNNRK